MTAPETWTCLLCAARAPKELWGPGRVTCPNCHQLQPSPRDLELMRPGFPSLAALDEDSACDACGTTSGLAVVFKGGRADTVRPAICVACIGVAHEKINLRHYSMAPQVRMAFVMDLQPRTPLPDCACPHRGGRAQKCADATARRMGAPPRSVGCACLCHGESRVSEGVQ